MTNGRPPYHHGDLHRSLTGLALEKIRSDGVESVSLRALARECGVTHRAAYQHFDDRDALLAAAIAEGHRLLHRRLARTAPAGKSPTGQLKAVAIAYGRFAFAEPNIFHAMNGPRVNTSGASPELEDAISKNWSYITAPLRQGAQTGQFISDTSLAAAVFWGGLQGVLAQAVADRIKLKKNRRDNFFAATGERLVKAITAD